MISFLTGWVRNIVVVVAVLSFLEMLLPEGGVRKFSRFIMGLIVILTVINPLVDWVGYQNWSTPQGDFPSVSGHTDDEVHSVLEEGQNIAKEGQNYMWREIQTQADGQVRGLLGLVDGVEDAEVLTQVDAAGRLRKVLVKIRSVEGNDSIANGTDGLLVPVAAVQPVEIEVGAIQQETEVISYDYQQRLTDRVRKLLTDFYGLSAAQIDVSFVD